MARVVQMKKAVYIQKLGSIEQNLGIKIYHHTYRRQKLFISHTVHPFFGIAGSELSLTHHVLRPVQYYTFIMAACLKSSLVFCITVTKGRSRLSLSCQPIIRSCNVLPEIMCFKFNELVTLSSIFSYLLSILNHLLLQIKYKTNL